MGGVVPMNRKLPGMAPREAAKSADKRQKTRLCGGFPGETLIFV